MKNDSRNVYVKRMSDIARQIINYKLEKEISLFHRAFWFIKFYSHQLMHFFIQLYISLLSYIKIT